MNTGRPFYVNRIRRAVLSLLVGWLMFSVAVRPTARAFVLEGESWPPNTKIVLDLQLGTPPATLIDGSTNWNQVAVAAINIWNPNLGDGVQFQTNSNVITPKEGDKKNSVFFSDTAYGEGFGTDTLAVTLLSYTQTTTTETDVIVAESQVWNSYRGDQRTNSFGAPEYDLRRVLLHEFGHVLGLDHVTDGTPSIMQPVISNLDTIQHDDIAGVADLYGSPDGKPVIISSLAASGLVGKAFQYQIQTVGATTKYGASGLPAGLSVNAASGLISGTPQAEGVYPVILSVTNSVGTTTNVLVLTIRMVPVITSPLTVTAYVGQPFYYVITATGEPTSFGAPYGLAYNSTTGVIAYEPTTALQDYFTISASNAVGTGSATLNISYVWDLNATVVKALGSSYFDKPFGSSPLVLGTDGNFYATGSGGYTGSGEFLYRLTPGGALTVLHTFSDAEGVGLHGVIQGQDGNFYGTATSGGSGTVGSTAYGTVFKITPAGGLTVLHTFTGNGDGLLPLRNVVQGSDGNLYGTTSESFVYGGAGTIFKVSPDGDFTTLYAFDGATVGYESSVLIQASDGNFYGTTVGGGPVGAGLIYQCTPAGVVTVVDSADFTGIVRPDGPLTQASDGALYGITVGAMDNTIPRLFRCTLDGQLTWLDLGAPFGSTQPGPLALARDGSFYSVGWYTDSAGTLQAAVMRFALDGTKTLVHRFGPDIGHVYGNVTLTEGASGVFYGVFDPSGDLYEIAPGIQPPPTSYVSATATAPVAGTIGSRQGAFTVTRTGDTSQALLVQLSYDGSARSGVDYAPLPATLVIPAGASSAACNVMAINPSLGDTPRPLSIHVNSGTGYLVDPVAGPAEVQIYGEPQAAVPLPAFFTGETNLGNGVYYLGFANGRYFGYYSYLADPRYIYHFDLGFEYWFDAADGKGGVYLYDFASQTFFYTSPAFPFPYLYDFSLNTVLYYYPDPDNAGRYNTDGYRFFYRFDNGQIIVK